MDKKLLQRLIGVSVIIALAAIFIPLLFVPARHLNVDEVTHVPMPPKAPVVKIEKASLQNIQQKKAPVVQKPVGQPLALNAKKILGPLTTKSTPVSLTSAHVATQKAQKSKLRLSPKKLAANLNVAKAQDKAWVVQLGSFSDEKNANTFVKHLQSEKLAAYTYKNQLSGKMIYQVYVGPFTELALAKTTLKQLNQEKIKGFLKPFLAATLH